MSEEYKANNQIKGSIKQIIDLLCNNKTTHEGLNKYNRLITDNINKKDKLTFIIHSISEYISKSTNQTAREVSFILLPEFFKIFPSIISTYPFISLILRTIQFNISNIDINISSSTFDSINKIIFNDSSLEDKNDKHNLELLQGFCVYNMKQKGNYCQITGAACLNVLINNCAYFLNEKYIKYLWEKIIASIESKDFECKFILLKCLISLISNVKESFRPYAVITLYKVIDFLIEDDVDIRKEALNVIYLLSCYCMEDIDPLKEQIIEFLEVLTSDKDDDIRKNCRLILREYGREDSIAQRRNKKGSVDNYIEQRSQDSSSKLKRMRKHNIFTTSRNNEFFERAKSQNEILVLDYSNEHNKNNNNISRYSSNSNNHSIIPISISINQSQNEFHTKSANENDMKKMMIYKNKSMSRVGEGNKRDEHENYVIYTYPNKDDNNNDKDKDRDRDRDRDRDINAKTQSQNYLHLINQLKTLSQNQVCLLDTVTLINSDFHKNLAKLSSRIEKLEHIYEKENTDSEQSNFRNALDNNDVESLIRIANDMSLSEIKEVNHLILEQVIDRLFISNDDYWENIEQSAQKKINLIKKIIIGTGINLNKTIVESLQHQITNMLKIYKDSLTNDYAIDVKLIQTYLDNGCCNYNLV